jgi:hypothetical protein
MKEGHHSPHPHHKGKGMASFKEGHWEKPLSDFQLSNEKYSKGEMSQGEEYKSSVDSLSHYARKHKEKH